MTCEALVIGSVAGLALTAAILSFQVITDRKTSKENPKIKNAKTITKDGFAA
jgi:predicted small secreted protein